jgi:hypothetical protein
MKVRNFVPQLSCLGYLSSITILGLVRSIGGEASPPQHPHAHTHMLIKYLAGVMSKASLHDIVMISDSFIERSLLV